jgi:hypothetical protein
MGYRIQSTVKFTGRGGEVHEAEKGRWCSIQNANGYWLDSTID